MQFIEVTSKDGRKELINASIIERIYVLRGKTYLKYKTDQQETPGMEVKEDYEAIKRQLLKQK
ncbi:MAG TPA: hypothetical protein VGI82_09860 [Chitinophagaceae bacterium]|jgi:hypothetical protein